MRTSMVFATLSLSLVIAACGKKPEPPPPAPTPEAPPPVEEVDRDVFANAENCPA